VGNKVILLNVRDDVATALIDLQANDAVTASLDDRIVDVVLTQDIAFGHKVALRNIAKGEEILKYGMPIGRALCDIGVGEWVHVHNCRSHRWGFQNDIYGLQA